ncbi:MAG: hypothetical protein BWX70_03465 [Verrucomicrobia bacterium ADurb.Bin070]|nr:MAG: hypothetical protein BWX70_03465 [Verrucomicrobia bacterium ADurb.Bin070]
MTEGGKPRLHGRHRIEIPRLLDIAARVERRDGQHIAIDLVRRAEPEHLAVCRERQVARPQRKQFGQPAFAAPAGRVLRHGEGNPFNLPGLQPGADLIHARHGQSFERVQRVAVVQGGTLRAVFSDHVSGRFDTDPPTPSGDRIEMRLAETPTEQAVVIRPHRIFGWIGQIGLHILAQPTPGGGAVLFFRPVEIAEQQVRLTRERNRRGMRRFIGENADDRPAQIRRQPLFITLVRQFDETSHGRQAVVVGPAGSMHDLP